MNKQALHLIVKNPGEEAVETNFRKKPGYTLYCYLVALKMFTV